jgi:hypothetical protein
MSSSDPNCSRSTSAAVVEDCAQTAMQPRSISPGNASESQPGEEALETVCSTWASLDDVPTDAPADASAPPADKLNASALDFLRPSGSWWRRRGRRTFTGFTLSLFVHGAILFLLSLWYTVTYIVPVQVVPMPPLLVEIKPPVVPEKIEVLVATPDVQGSCLERAPVTASELPAGDVTGQMESVAIPFPKHALKDTAGWHVAPPREPLLPKVDWLATNGVAEGGGLEGRIPEARHRLLAERGGTEASEAAVNLGLQWFTSAQLDDGSWRFNHHAGPLRGKCRNPGSAATTTGATALALLSYLGAGVTLEADDEHAGAVAGGLNYLLNRQIVTLYGADLQEGTMYAQGLATSALCEAYAMNGNPELQEAAQRAIDFICYAQHEEGGWRYFPGQPGDMTVTAWQLMALKSGQMAGLHVPRESIRRATGFLSQLQEEDGAYYGYLAPGKEPTPTAIGLLTRMYTGWSRGDDRLQKGVDYVAAFRPSRTDMYFNYYATQLLHHFEGPHWDTWNEEMREYLIETQSQEGDERGSWYFSDRHGIQGGRHYNTAMAVMILEVYYRYMPLYTESTVQEEW